MPVILYIIYYSQCDANEIHDFSESLLAVMLMIFTLLRTPVCGELCAQSMLIETVKVEVHPAKAHNSRSFAHT